jgi:HNH endonuclease/NUMOD4 motif
VTMPLDDIEEWRPVTRAPEYYEVSNLGRVRRALDAPQGPYTSSTWPGRIRKPFPGHHGYLFVQLVVTKRTLYAGPVHILVAEAFLAPKPTSRHTVNHIDGDKTNNRCENLAWATHLEQTQHAIRLGLMDPRHLKKFTLLGETHRQAKLTEEIVRVIRYAPIRFSSVDLAELFGVHTSTISKIRTRKTWGHVS